MEIDVLTRPESWQAAPPPPWVNTVTLADARSDRPSSAAFSFEKTKRGGRYSQTAVRAFTGEHRIKRARKIGDFRSARDHYGRNNGENVRVVLVGSLGFTAVGDGGVYQLKLTLYFILGENNIYIYFEPQTRQVRNKHAEQHNGGQERRSILQTTLHASRVAWFGGVPVTWIFL